MKKILWLSNYYATTKKIKTSGTWLNAMMDALVKTGEVQMFNITRGNVKGYIRDDCFGISQWVIPFEKANNKGLPSKATINFIKDVVEEIDPDLVHIWGTENFWASLAAHGLFKKPVLLDMQGIMYAIAFSFYGGLTNRELLKCIGLREILLPNRSLFWMRNEFLRRGKIEQQVIKKMKYISVQSEWVKAHVEYENPNAEIFQTGRLLRSEFYEAKPWSNPINSDPVIYTSSSGAAAYKGLHVLFRALVVLKNKYPGIKLKIAGSFHKHGFFNDGYAKWLLSEAKSLGITDSVEWLGAIDANEIINQLQHCSVAVVPSYVESYCLALAEAMMVGTPIVVSFTAAMAEAAKHNDSALYFPVGDHMLCAYQIEKILKNNSLAEHLSEKSRAISLERNNSQAIVNNQLSIYKKLIL